MTLSVNCLMAIIPKREWPETDCPAVKSNASHNRIGRLMLREDGTGAIEYFYGKMGEVTKTRRQ